MTAAPSDLEWQSVAGAPLGLTLTPTGARMAVYSSEAERIELCLFEGDREVRRIPLTRGPDDVHAGLVAGIVPGTHYGLRAHGPWRPHEGLRFNPAALLIDPYAARLSTPPTATGLFDPTRDGVDDLIRDDRDTASIVPRCIVEAPARDMPRPARPTITDRVIYELHPKGFTRLHQELAPAERGTLRGLADPRIVDYLRSLGITTVELMPIAAALDERHLPALGLRNAWGYNPLALMAPDPRLAPGGIADVMAMVDAFHAAGIEVILDVVLNHTAESDERGATLSLRGLDNRMYYRLQDQQRYYVNDSGCGHVLALDRPAVGRLALDALRYWAMVAGVDGFRMDLGTVLGRTASGFDANAALLRAIDADPVLRDRVIIVEPWDIGWGGYRLGEFPHRFHEWNDRFRDDVRRFWRGDGSVGALATRLAGSSDVFQARGRPPSRSVNFVAAHDGFTVADTVRYDHRQNHANGEEGRDGHAGEVSWSGGTVADEAALLVTLLVARGTPMLSMGAERSRTQQGNNNAYAQDNALNAMPWHGDDGALQALVTAAIAARPALSPLRVDRFGTAGDMRWLAADGFDLEPVDWQSPRDALGWLTTSDDEAVLVWFVRRRACTVTLPITDRAGGCWRNVLDSRGDVRADTAAGERLVLDAPSVSVWRWSGGEACDAFPQGSTTMA